MGVENGPVLQTQAGQAAQTRFRTGLGIAASAVDADAVFAIPERHGYGILKMSGGGWPKRTVVPSGTLSSAFRRYHTVKWVGLR